MPISAIALISVMTPIHNAISAIALISVMTPIHNAISVTALTSLITPIHNAISVTALISVMAASVRPRRSNVMPNTALLPGICKSSLNHH